MLTTTLFFSVAFIFKSPGTPAGRGCYVPRAGCGWRRPAALDSPRAGGQHAEAQPRSSEQRCPPFHRLPHQVLASRSRQESVCDRSLWDFTVQAGGAPGRALPQVHQEILHSVTIGWGLIGVHLKAGFISSYRNLNNSFNTSFSLNWCFIVAHPRGDSR